MLYVVIAAGALALVVWARATPPAAVEPPPGWLERALALFVVLYALQALYTPAASLAKAVEDVCFFLVPFSLLFVLLRRIRWDRELLVRCGLAVVALALLFVAVGAAEYASRRLIFNTALNSNQRYFRINSLFYDPNIFGRFLALTMVLVITAMLWEHERGRVLIGAAVLVALWFALLGTASQSSMLALLAGLAVIAATRFSVASARSPPSPSSSPAPSSRSPPRAACTSTSPPPRPPTTPPATAPRSSSRASTCSSTARSPGSARRRSRASTCATPAAQPAAPRAASSSDSHTIPITVAAEQGVVGLAAYVLLLVGGVLAARARGRAAQRGARVAILAAFVALVVHTWAYADFLEDPITWALLAVGTVLARAPGGTGACAST